MDVNPTRAGIGWPPAVIAGAFQTGVLAVRSLVRRGVRAVCFDCNRSNPGFTSVYGPAVECPDPDTDSAGWLQFMLELAATFPQKPALIASSDQFVSAVARHSAALSDRYFVSPGIALQGLLADKPTQYDLAARHGMPMPVTRFARSLDDVKAFAQAASYPCLIKPTHFREWRRLPTTHSLFGTKIAIADSEYALLEQYELACDANPNVILQEIIAGRDTSKRVYLACYDADRRRIANAMFRELRCDPVGFGPATVTEPIDDPEVDELCDSFLRSIGYVGICEIEVKRDSRDGRVKLIEANPRLSGSGDAAPYAGVDLCWLNYLDLIGQTVIPVTPRNGHFKHVVLRADGSAAIAYWSAGLISWRDIVDSYRPPLAFYDLDRSDWRYSAETMYIAGRSLLTGLLRHLSTRMGRRG